MAGERRLSTVDLQPGGLSKYLLHTLACCYCVSETCDTQCAEALLAAAHMTVSADISFIVRISSKFGQ